ncbi:hypothetical protein J2W79_000757 [Methylorubrum extorquens]|nr:hypothetical protein [Methylorubrum extorquens]
MGLDHRYGKRSLSCSVTAGKSQAHVVSPSTRRHSMNSGW